jgi:hypothetical protein
MGRSGFGWTVASGFVTLHKTELPSREKSSIVTHPQYETSVKWSHLMLILSGRCTTYIPLSDHCMWATKASRRPQASKP